MASKLTFGGVVGFLLAAIGAFVALANWPDTTTTSEVTVNGLEPSVTSVTETGNETAANVGLMMLGVGSTMLWVVLIALGVYCGLRMHEERSQPGPERVQPGPKRSRRSHSRPLSTTEQERLNREAQQRIAAKRAAEKRPRT